jgi:regulatory protein
MKLIEDVQKDRKGFKILVDHKTYWLAQEIYVKHRLTINQEIDESELKTILEENQMFMLDQLALKKLKKMLTVFELKTILTKAGAKSSQIKVLVERYLKYKYLDDKLYAKTYFEKKKFSEGPKLIFANLLKKGISHEDIELVFKDYDQQDIIKKLLVQKLKTFKNKNKQQIYVHLKTFFLQKGFDDENLDQIIESTVSKVKVDASQLIHKEIDKLTRKYQLKYNDHELTFLIKQKLLQKGFSPAEIEQFYETKTA